MIGKLPGEFFVGFVAPRVKRFERILIEVEHPGFIGETSCDFRIMQNLIVSGLLFEIRSVLTAKLIRHFQALAGDRLEKRIIDLGDIEISDQNYILVDNVLVFASVVHPLGHHLERLDTGLLPFAPSYMCTYDDEIETAGAFVVNVGEPFPVAAVILDEIGENNPSVRAEDIQDLF
jgi:hypothetical protein